MSLSAIAFSLFALCAVATATVTADSTPAQAAVNSTPTPAPSYDEEVCAENLLVCLEACDAPNAGGRACKRFCMSEYQDCLAQ